MSLLKKQLGRNMAFPSERSEETGEASVAMRVIEMYVIDRDASDRDRQPRFLLWHLCELRGVWDVESPTHGRYLAPSALGAPCLTLSALD